MWRSSRHERLAAPSRIARRRGRHHPERLAGLPARNVRDADPTRRGPAPAIWRRRTADLRTAPGGTRAPRPGWLGRQGAADRTVRRRLPARDDRARTGGLRPGVPVGHPQPVPTPHHRPRRRAAPGVAAGSPRLLHARHVGRRSGGCRIDRPGRARRDQRADAPHARRHVDPLRTDRRVLHHRPTAPAAPTAAGDRGRGVDRRDDRWPDRGWVGRPGWHRRDPQRRAVTPARQARARHPHRDVLGRNRRSVRIGRDHQPHEDHLPRPHRHELRRRYRPDLRLRARQPARRVPALRPDQRRAPPREAREARRDQLRARGGPDRPDLRRLDRAPDLLGDRRSDGLRPGRVDLPRRKADPRAPVHRARRNGVTDHHRAPRRVGRRDDAWPRALGRHRVRRGQPARQDAAPAGGGPDQPRTP